jgi:hypothetical protein
MLKETGDEIRSTNTSADGALLYFMPKREAK